MYSRCYFRVAIIFQLKVKVECFKIVTKHVWDLLLWHISVHVSMICLCCRGRWRSSWLRCRTARRDTPRPSISCGDNSRRPRYWEHFPLNTNVISHTETSAVEITVTFSAVCKLSSSKLLTSEGPEKLYNLFIVNMGLLYFCVFIKKALDSWLLGAAVYFPTWRARSYVILRCSETLAMFKVNVLCNYLDITCPV